jgi:capsule biosynthesis phosphatase
MIEGKKVIVIDVDGTMCIKGEKQAYEDASPNEKVLSMLRKYKKEGFYIIIDSSRNMRTFEGNVGRINAVTLKILMAWLDKHNVPYDEIHMGKPWAGTEGFYVDDSTVRPSEFLSKSYEEIMQLLEKESPRTCRTRN